MAHLAYIEDKNDLVDFKFIVLIIALENQTVQRMERVP